MRFKINRVTVVTIEQPVEFAKAYECGVEAARPDHQLNQPHELAAEKAEREPEFSLPAMWLWRMRRLHLPGAITARGACRDGDLAEPQAT